MFSASGANFEVESPHSRAFKRFSIAVAAGSMALRAVSVLLGDDEG